ncbi:MAG: adenylate/guanylate cyclase domain-containing protein [Acidobacteriia bacterium]|nr:adenylate/guanylate cyclase domain-containing protein [Terriglobia bacterium]
MNSVLKKIGETWGKFADLVGRVPAKRVDMGIAAAVTLLAMVVYVLVAITAQTRALFGFLDTMELRSLDARYKTRGPRHSCTGQAASRDCIDDRIVIIGLDEKTLQKVGSYPIARNYYAKAVDQLTAGGARVIGFDFDFPTPEKNSAVEKLKELESQVSGSVSPAVLEKIREIERTSDNDAILADSMKRAGNVVLGHIFLGEDRAKQIDAKASEDYYNVLWGHPFPQMQKLTGNFDLGKAWFDPVAGHEGGVGYGIESNIRILAEAARSYGFFNYGPERDGIYRRAPALIRYQDREWFPSLPIEMLKVYENIKDQSEVAYMGSNGLERMEVGPHSFFTQPDGSFLINFAGPFKTYPHYSMADVMDGTVPPPRFKGKIVILGATALGIGDLRPMPFQTTDYMGVELHANVLDNLLNNDIPGRGFLKRGIYEESIDIVFILLFGVGMGYLFARLQPLYSTFSVIAALVAFYGITYFAFTHYGMWLYFVIPAGALVVNYGAITSFRMVFEEREKRKVRKMLSSYVSPGVIHLIEQDPKKYFKTGGESKELTIMFSDIRSFTTISEGLTPDALVTLLNEYLGEMTDILFTRWGTLDKYIGDALMAFWGSPFPQDDHSVRACHAALDMSKRLEELNLKWEVEGKKPLSIGIGINTGTVNVGNMGSSRRFAWTVMGDPVNLASRLEGQNKEYHTARIISEFTYAQVKDHYVCRDLDRIRVKGKLKPVKIYELMDFGKNAEKHRDLLTRWHDAQDAFYRMAWDEAVQKFEALLGNYPDDGPTETFLKRAYDYYKEPPAAGWDGVYVAKTK